MATAMDEGNVARSQSGRRFQGCHFPAKTAAVKTSRRKGPKAKK
jgi:hypothetical protein